MADRDFTNDEYALEEIYNAGGFGLVKCTNCSFYHEWEEHHPYGETTAAETLAECKCEVAAECPAYPYYLDYIIETATQLKENL